MRKWEEKYEKLKNGEFDSRIDELKLKIDDKTATREEFKEYQKLEKSKGNIDKVKNVLEYREKAQLFLDDLKKELTIREDIKKADQESLKIEVELIQTEKELESVYTQLKDKTLDDEKRAELEAKKSLLIGKIDENNKKYVENQELLKGGLNRNEELKGYSDEQLQKLKLETSSRISKCNMVANSLVNGLSWDSIDLKLDNWKRYTNKDKKLSNKDKTDDKSKPDETKGQSNGEETGKANEEELRKKAEKRAQFEAKHPRLAKIGKWFNKLFGKDKFLPEPTKTKLQTEAEQSENKEILDVDKSFKEYIKQVAEKGMDGIAAEEKAARQVAAKEKLAQMRAANRAAEAQKFGQDYANKSDFRTNNDGESR